jgi:1-deoxy-D-xylulose-5-phosphate synthase
MLEEAKCDLLQSIDDPQDLRDLPESQLTQVAREMRAFFIDSVSRSGGHFAAGLGTVELSIALHYVFKTPEDRLLWDVGHQAYPHKILTGRREQIHTIRKKDGLSGFPKRSESLYDTFGVAHAGTTISAALGMASALACSNAADRHVVAVIGDGAMTAGMAFEALHHAGDLGLNLLIILNDNNMSISPAVGALPKYFTELVSATHYVAVDQTGGKVSKRKLRLEAFTRRCGDQQVEDKNPGAFFEALGLDYFGPIDGHDLTSLVATLHSLKPIKGPRLLHVVTRKGEGYPPAEADPVAYHGVGPFNPKQTLKPSNTKGPPSYTQVFGDWLCDIAEHDPRVTGITPAMREGSGLVDFCQRYPERYFDVGIAEQHAVTLAAGQACEGFKPVVAIYSTFLQRAYDQLIHDVALQNLPVLFAIDRAGLVGPDGPTHAGSFDLTYLRCIPNMIVMTPADENECRQMLYTGLLQNQPTAVRYPRGKGVGVAVEKRMTAVPIGVSQICMEGKDIALLAFGSMVQVAQEVGEKLGATVVNMRFVKPLDEERVLELAERHELLVTLEDNAVMGGAGGAVNEFLLAQQVLVSVLNLGLPDLFAEHGSREELLADSGLTPAAVLEAVKSRYQDIRLQTEQQSNVLQRTVRIATR